jgi:fatty acid desaturase
MPSTVRETGAALRWAAMSSGKAAKKSTSARLTPILLFFRFPFLVVLLVFVLIILVEIEIVFVFVVLIIRPEFDWIHTGDGQRSSTLIARKNVSLVQLFFFHIDRSIAFWATDHRN